LFILQSKGDNESFPHSSLRKHLLEIFFLQRTLLRERLSNFNSFDSFKKKNKKRPRLSLAKDERYFRGTTFIQKQKNCFPLIGI
ncbi:MAG: hypothetical protein KAZ09_02565, partial [Enterococcus sp.]|nr:hypothetical protein [Enterococcus sp.]